MTVWGRSGELNATQNMIRDAFPGGYLSVVSDSYDLWNFIDNILGKDLKDIVANRPDGALVVRPDSGDPATIVCKVLNKLGDIFGTKTNSKGFKMLPDYIRVIQGDGISYETIGEILSAMEKEGWSSDNLTFGSGGGLLQKMNRDTQKCAYKCCLAIIDGKKVKLLLMFVDFMLPKTLIVHLETGRCL